MSTSSIFLGTSVLVAAAAAAAADTIEIEVGSFYFDPPFVNVSPGDTIEWQWGFGGFHNVVSGDECGASDLIFESPGQSSGTWQWQVPQAAASHYEYYCGIGGHCISGNQYGVLLVDAGEVHLVSTDGFTFVPEQITVREGDVVLFENGGGSHDVTFGENCVADGNFFSTLTNINPLAVWRVPAGTAGSVQPYFCSPHCSFGMVGQIIIEADAEPCTADVNNDNVVDVNDLLDLLAAYGNLCSNCPEDIDGSGEVGVDDLLSLLGDYGQVCP